MHKKTIAAMGMTLAMGKAAPALAQAERYGLEAYLNDVKSTHEGIKASEASVEAAKLKEEEADLPYSWNAFATSQSTWDKRETANPKAQGDSTRIDAASAGLSKLWTSGTVTKFSYSAADTHIYGANPQFLPSDHFVTTGPNIEVSHPLWRNSGGAELKAAREAASSQANLVELQEAFKTKNIMQVSEQSYWRLVLAREAVAAQKQSLERFQKLKSWSSKRVDDALADRSDLLQADAAVKGKQLELRLAQDEERAAARDFNLGRGRDSDEVIEKLTVIDDALVESIEPPPYKTAREDVRAAKEAVLLAQASQKLSEEKYAPTLDLFGSAGLNGRDPSLGKSAQESLQTSHPLLTVGLKLTAPLDQDLIHRAQSGYIRERTASELNAKRKELETQIQYKELVAQFENARTRFKLAESIETSQKQKLEHEKERHRVGRTTTYQVLLFEQDFASSQLSRIRAQADVMRIAALLKTFGG